MSWSKWQEPGAAGRRWGESGGARAGCCVLFCHAAFPAASCFRPESAHITASGARPPQQVLPAAQPQPPACSVCFPFHFTKCLLIFSTKSQCLPRGAQVSTH